MDLLHRHLPSAIVLTLPTNPLPSPAQPSQLLLLSSVSLRGSCALMINTLDHSPQSTPQLVGEQHPYQRSVNTQLTLSLINNHSIVICYWVSTDSCILWKLVDSWLRCWWGVNRVSTEVLMKYPLSSDQVLIEGIDWHLTKDVFGKHDPAWVTWFT